MALPIPLPDSSLALQFAVMISSGMPGEEAIKYFIPEDDPDPTGTGKAMYNKWIRSKAVKDAFKALEGKSWQEMSGEERISRALDLHYNQLAYFLYSTNYSSLVGSDKQKADTCRSALEAKLAGSAGKMDALTKFLDDLASGKAKLTASSPSLARSTTPTQPAPLRAGLVEES